jgi:hypothetical protein
MSTKKEVVIDQEVEDYIINGFWSQNWAAAYILSVLALAAVFCTILVSGGQILWKMGSGYLVSLWGFFHPLIIAVGAFVCGSALRRCSFWNPTMERPKKDLAETPQGGKK